jgi:hypothetical protein
MGARRCAMAGWDWQAKLAGKQVRTGEVEGKTIAHGCYDGVRLGLRFTDGTYLYVEAADDGFEDVSLEPQAEININDAAELGLIAADDFLAWKAERLRQEEEQDRAEYERLKAKFEGE